MNLRPARVRVGDLRPTQLLFSFGIGSIVDLPNLSAMVMGLEDWDTNYLRPLEGERLLAAVRAHLGNQVERLCLPPVAEGDGSGLFDPFEDTATVGVPVAAFPRWVRCPWCSLLAPLGSGLFELKHEPYYPDRTRYVHANCLKPGRPPGVLPARFLVACEHGHLDDFPWVSYVHRGATGCRGPLRLREYGVSGEAADVEVKCEACGKARRMVEAFGEEGQRSLPSCPGRRPHLRDFAADPCTQRVKTILLGASNSWFPLTLSALTVPTATDQLGQLVEQHWPVLANATSQEVLGAFRQIGQLAAFAEYSLEQVWEAVEAHRAATVQVPEGEMAQASDLKSPEWQILSAADPARNSDEFRLRRVESPAGFERFFEKVVLVERLREVRALVGFTRIESPGDFSDEQELPAERRAAISRRATTWVPASEVRGEGIFIQFREEAIAAWCSRAEVATRAQSFFEAHVAWRRMRQIDPAVAGFPGIRYALLHSFAHALMRQVALECGYTAASIRERIYARDHSAEQEPMAGVLIYTAAPDSEGTLGGLVGLGDPRSLGRHLEQAFEHARLCASDPLCSEHDAHEGTTLHGAACHACLFSPETSCERGNRYLDRALLVTGLVGGPAFFDGW